MDTAGDDDDEKACIFANTSPIVRKAMNTIPVIDIDNNVAFDSGFINVSNKEPVLMDNKISSSGKSKDIWSK